MMDIVYILRSDVHRSEEVLRYSLRSLVNLPHRRVFVVGGKCEWFSEKVIHIPADDPYRIAARNAAHKLRIACEHAGEDMLVMNDDIFILKPDVYLGAVYKRTLGESLRLYGSENGYYEAIKNTVDLFGEDALDYSTHRPFRCEKSKLRSMLGDLPDKPFLVRSVYDNTYSTGVPGKDAKVYRAEELALHTDVVSTCRAVEETEAFRDFVRERFPEASVYERCVV